MPISDEYRANMPPIFRHGLEVVEVIAHDPAGPVRPSRVELVICHTATIHDASNIVAAMRRAYGTPAAWSANTWPRISFYWRSANPHSRQKTQA